MYRRCGEAGEMLGGCDARQWCTAVVDSARCLALPRSPPSLHACVVIPHGLLRLQGTL